MDKQEYESRTSVNGTTNPDIMDDAIDYYILPITSAMRTHISINNHSEMQLRVKVEVAYDDIQHTLLCYAMLY